MAVATRAGRGSGAAAARVRRLSIEVSRRCSKACEFCYSESGPDGASFWTEDSLADFITDAAAHGVEHVSFGGGEPLEWAPIFATLDRVRAIVTRSITTNGLPLLDRVTLARLIAAAPDKVHVSIHFPDRRAEVDRVIATLRALEDAGIPSGVNLLVRRSQRAVAARAHARLRRAGLDAARIILLPMRGHAGVAGQDTPTAEELASMLPRGPFQSMSCLVECSRSERFVSIGWDRRVAWCSYTSARAPLDEPTWRGLAHALDGLALAWCGAKPRTSDDAGSARRPSLPLVDDDGRNRPGADDAAERTAVHTPATGDGTAAAAHSMDTEWWAVDFDGHVAAFRSGEAGAVPQCAPPGQEPGGEGEDALRADPPIGERIADLGGRLLGTAHRSATADPGGLLLFVRSLTRVEEAVRAGRARRIPSTAGFGIVAHAMTAGELAAIHRAGDCLGCFYHWEYDDRPSLAAFGVYLYSHVDFCENWISGPYGREEIPSEPVLVDALPKVLARVARRVRFDGFCFQEREFIQPVEDFACRSWQIAWLESNARFARPMPGDELHYMERYSAQLAERVPEEIAEDALVWLPAKDEWLRRG